MPPLSDPAVRPLLDDLRARQLAWTRAYLVSAEAERSYRSLLEHGWEAILATRVSDLVDATSLADALDVLLDTRAVREGIAPLSRALRGYVLRELRSDEARLGDYVPARAREWIEALAARSGPMRTRIVRVVVEHETTEQVMRDVLHDALSEFSRKVNPFFAEWGLPALLKRVLPLGAGAVLRSMESVKAEFDKRLEPEIRRFLQGFSRQALRKVGSMLTADEETPQTAALRRAILDAILEQTVRDLAAEIDEEGVVLAQGIADEVLANALSMPSLRARRHAALDAFVKTYGAATVREVLEHHGIAWAPDFDALAAATWPAVAAALASGPVQATVESAIHRFYDELLGT